MNLLRHFAYVAFKSLYISLLARMLDAKIRAHSYIRCISLLSTAWFAIDLDLRLTACQNMNGSGFVNGLPAVVDSVRPTVRFRASGPERSSKRAVEGAKEPSIDRAIDRFSEQASDLAIEQNKKQPKNPVETAKTESLRETNRFIK